MEELQTADVCRDGGSIAIDFTDEKDNLYSILLEVSFDREGSVFYNHLYCGEEIQNICDVETIVEPKSKKEKKAIDLVSNWVNKNSSPKQIEELRESGIKGKDEQARKIYWCVRFLDEVKNRKNA